ncbi:MAG: fimbria major subunit, partial [Muribaculaceae bacterium]|nr:fimbria major subunit [Muribaculaceae bacterium]
MGFPHLRQAAIQSAVTINSVGNMEINRSGTLYKAVFGDGPIPGNNLYIIVNENNQIVGQTNVVDPEWTPNEPGWTSSTAYLAYINSADYAFQQWYNAGRPVDEIGDATTPVLLENFRNVVTGNGVAIFQSSVDDKFGPGYYCYYYYWNRHNDNGRNGVMGPMEFDVVRNNVYKISVDKVSHLGHPRIPTNDPENPTPNAPAESDLI